MNSKQLSDILWEIDKLINKQQEILGDKRNLTKEEISEFNKNKKEIDKLFKEIEDE